MPNTYAQTSAKKFMDAAGLTYLAQKLNNYPTNDVIAAVIDGVQDALDEKVDSVQYDSTNKKITVTIAGQTVDVVSVATLEAAMDLSNIDAITNAQIDALFA